MSDERYKCTLCNRQFQSTHTINRHLNRKIPCTAEGKKEYKDKKKTCRFCKKTLSNYHILYHHETICKKKNVMLGNGQTDMPNIINENNGVKNLPPNIKHNDQINQINQPGGQVPVQAQTPAQVPALAPAPPQAQSNGENSIEAMKNKLEELTRQMEQMRLQQHEETTKLREEIQKLNKGKKNKIIVNQNNNDNSSNNYIGNINNFNIIAYGKETCDHISENMFKKIIDKGFKSVPYLVEQMHFNKDKPEYHNIYISNMRDNHVLIYNGEKWTLAERDTVLDSMMDAKHFILSDKFDELKDNLGEHTKTRFQRFLNESDSDKVKNQIKNDLKLSLYNNKQMTENTKQKVAIKP